VLADGEEDFVAPWAGRERDAVLHDPAREMRVIWLRHQDDSVTDGTNDHRRRSSIYGTPGGVPSIYRNVLTTFPPSTGTS
jgi:hypothetical protein